MAAYSARTRRRTRAEYDRLIDVGAFLPDEPVEVAESTVLFGREHKGSLYARARLDDYWIVNLVDRVGNLPTARSGHVGRGSAGATLRRRS